LSVSIALIPNDVIGKNMAGPGIRYWEFAHVLSKNFHVRLIIPPYVKIHSEPSFKDIPFDLHICRNEVDFKRAVEANDIIITLGVIVFLYPFLEELDKPLVLDIYNPFLLEGLQCDVDADELSRWTTFESDLQALRQQLLAGDFFVCASERQRDFWLGMLAAVGRINPHTHRQDPTLRRLIDVVPFGLPGSLPQHMHSVLKGVYPGISAEDQVILWAGGIWNWLDPLSIIQAMPLVLKKRPQTRLFFMGIKRPNLSTPNLKAVKAAINLSLELGLLDRYVFFNDWVAYRERQNFLLEADVGISLHLDHIETHFSFRTRLLDHLWAGLPTVATRGDVLGAQMAEQGLAHLVAPRDVPGIARAVVEFLTDVELRDKLQPQFSQLASRYHWDVVCQPLLNFCRVPYQAPDKAHLAKHFVMRNHHTLSYKVYRALRMGGVAGLLQQTKEYLDFWCDES
jgi:glycosyltransferase involved in cell wall biosynthesis